MHTRRFLASLALIVASCGASASAALAQDFQGTTASWGKLTASVSDGAVTAFKTKTGRLQGCGGQPDRGSSSDPQDLTYSGPPVAVIGGRFHLEGTTTDVWGDPFNWTVDGSISLDGRELSGTATTSGDTVFDKGCVGTWRFDAIVPPHRADLPVKRTFAAADNNRLFNPKVTFDYAHGVIRHLTAYSRVECPDHSVSDAEVNTTAYDIDPVRVDKAGRFRVAGAVLDGYGVVNHVVLSGRIKGHVATGTVTADRYDSLSNQSAKCAGDTVWRSTTTASTTTRAPAAFFDVDPIRYGSHPGPWSYYLVVKVTACAHANRARVALAGGAAKTTSCHGKVRLGPLTPRRVYRIKVTALKTRHGRVLRRAPAVPTEVYLPGEDGDWIRL